MIVSYSDRGWQIVTQRAHGLLAGQLAMEWEVSERPQRWFETLLAIAEHDDAEVELNGENLLTEQGGPLNFNMKTFDPDHCTKLNELSITKSRFIALLTSMHMNYLYQNEKEAASFLKDQKMLQNNWRKDLGISKTEAEKIYCLLEWCDAFSLLLCKNDVQPEQRSIEISTGPKSDKFYLYKIEEGILTLDPWPFESSSFKVCFETRTIAQLQFKSSSEFRKAFFEASVDEVEWQLTKSKIPHSKVNKSEV